jgi:hypothetical protein
MSTYTYAQLVTIAKQNGFTGLSADIIAAIAMAESSGNTTAQHVNADGTLDRGVLQINSYWHPEVSDTCAYDAACSFKQAYRISTYGQNFNPWVTYTSGAYRKYLSGTSNSGNAPVSTNNFVDIFGSGYQASANPIDDVNNLIKALTASQFWAWLTNPSRVIKMLAGLGLVIISIVLLIEPDLIGQAGGLISGQTSA